MSEKTAVQRFQERVVAMVEAGNTGWHITPGPTWHGMSIEERCAAILQIWDVPRPTLPEQRSLTKEESDLMWKAVFESSDDGRLERARKEG